MRKAFTLIELLVVIAIIAILAAILFPVFAQAKASAKATASLSNSKQINLGILMYAQDADDNFVIAQANGTQPGSFTVPGMLLQVTPWTSLTQSYSKNVDILRDPLGPSATTIAPFTRNDSILIAPTFGFNFAYLNTYQANGFGSMSATSVGDPAGTVMTAPKADYTETGGFKVFTPPAPAVGWNACTSYLAFPPAGSGMGTSYNWGIGGVFASAISAPEAGRVTGGNSPRFASMMAISFVDGHAKRLRAGAVAAGTGFNWSSGSNATAVGGVTVPTDATNLGLYIWDIQ